MCFLVLRAVNFPPFGETRWEVSAGLLGGGPVTDRMEGGEGAAQGQHVGLSGAGFRF